MDSTTTAATAVAVPVGSTTMVDPQTLGRVTRASAVEPSPVARALVAAARLQTAPEIDGEACGRNVAYPRQAEELGIEGDVKLRVALDERGRVLRVDVLSGPGHGLEAVAADALAHRCRFTPAIGSDGKPMPFVIPSYTFHFAVPR
jgi:TonB family protein